MPGWGGRDSNLRMVESKSTALPLGDAPIGCLESGGTIAARIPSRQRRSIEGVEPFQQAERLNSGRIRTGARSSLRVIWPRDHASGPKMPFRRQLPARFRHGELRECRFRGKTAVRCPNPEARHRHDLSRADQRHAAGPQSWRRPAGRRESRPLRRFRRRHHRRRAGGSRQIRLRRAGAAQPGRRRARHQARGRQGDHRPRLARCLPALDRGRLERGVRPGSVRRPGPAARDQRRLHRNLERVEYRLRPLPAADAERDRGARRPWQRRS